MTLWRVSGLASANDGDPISWSTIIEHNKRHRAILLGYSALLSNYPDQKIEPVRGSWGAYEIEIPNCAACKKSMGDTLSALFTHRCE